MPPAMHLYTEEKRQRLSVFSPKEEAEADFMAEMADKVYYIPMYEADVNCGRFRRSFEGKASVRRGIIKGSGTCDRPEPL